MKIGDTMVLELVQGVAGCAGCKFEGDGTPGCSLAGICGINDDSIFIESVNYVAVPRDEYRRLRECAMEYVDEYEPEKNPREEFPDRR